MTGARQTGLDLLRALAIVLTCAMHFVWAIGAWRYERNFELFPISAARSVDEAAWMWLYHSQHGVYLFFVLSGYLLSKRWLVEKKATLVRYLIDRAWRTLPGAWLALLVALGLLAAAGKIPNNAVLLLLENALFLNWFRTDDLHHLLIITWSLQAEWLFYLALPIVAWCAQRAGGAPRAQVATVLLFGAAAIVLFKLTSTRGAAYAFFFTTGALSAVMQDQWRGFVRAAPWWAIIAAYVGINGLYAWSTATAARLQAPGFNAFEWHAVAFAVIASLMALKAAEHAFGNGWMVRLGQHIGRISYSIYLWHLLVMLTLMQWFGLPSRLDFLPDGLAVAAFLSLLIGVTWVVSLLSFALIERPYFARRNVQAAHALKSKD